MTPEEKLCSRSWRLRNSAGVLWSILSFGTLTGVNFLIRGSKTRNGAWIAMGVGFLVVGVGVIATAGLANPGTKEAPIRTAYTDIWGWLWFTTFVAGVVISFITNKKWLIWKAHANEVKWYAAAGASQAPGASPVRGYDPNAAAAAFNPQPLSAPAPQQFSAPAPQPTAAALDVNSASAQELVTALGVDGETAARILQARQATGSFTSFEQLMTRAQVPPHLLIPHRDKISFGAPSGSAPGAPQPQTLDPNSRKARRLFD